MPVATATGTSPTNFTPLSNSMPDISTAAELAAVIRDSTTPLRVLGGGWFQDTDGAELLRLDGLSGIHRLDADDMTVTVAAGKLWADFAEELKSAGREVPIDVVGDDVTVGSAVSAGIAGPRQQTCGSWRDWVLGVEAVDGHGRVFRGGGRVVKNVAGYDLVKLLVGSGGRFAVLTEVTFRVQPLPPARMLFSRPSDSPTEALAELRRLEHSSDAAEFAIAASRQLIVSLAGHTDDVRNDAHHLTEAGYAETSGDRIFIATLGNNSRLVTVRRTQLDGVVSNGTATQFDAHGRVVLIDDGARSFQDIGIPVRNPRLRPTTEAGSIADRLRAAFDPRSVFAD